MRFGIERAASGGSRLGIGSEPRIRQHKIEAIGFERRFRLNRDGGSWCNAWGHVERWYPRSKQDQRLISWPKFI